MGKEEILVRIEEELNTCVRPTLGRHGGDVQVLSFKDGLLKLRMLGPCANCPSAVYENEQLFETELKRRIPQIEHVMLATGVSDELIAAARALMKNQ